MWKHLVQCFINWRVFLWRHTSLTLWNSVIHYLTVILACHCYTTSSLFLVTTCTLFRVSYIHFFFPDDFHSWSSSSTRLFQLLDESEDKIVSFSTCIWKGSRELRCFVFFYHSSCRLAQFAVMSGAIRLGVEAHSLLSRGLDDVLSYLSFRNVDIFMHCTTVKLL